MGTPKFSMDAPKLSTDSIWACPNSVRTQYGHAKTQFATRGQLADNARIFRGHLVDNSRTARAQLADKLVYNLRAIRGQLRTRGQLTGQLVTRGQVADKSRTIRGQLADKSWIAQTTRRYLAMWRDGCPGGRRILRGSTTVSGDGGCGSRSEPASRRAQRSAMCIPGSAVLTCGEMLRRRTGV